jgi:hypothetical protein
MEKNSIKSPKPEREQPLLSDCCRKGTADNQIRAVEGRLPSTKISSSRSNNIMAER